jgi:aspartate aminotransferase-like enzyme
MDEGLPSVFARHERVRDRLREGTGRLGFTPFAPDDIASRTVTALYPPRGMFARQLVAEMHERGVVLAGGQGRYEHTLLRIGHMGFVTDQDIDSLLTGLELVVGNGVLEMPGLANVAAGSR